MAYATLADLLARGVTRRELIERTNRDVDGAQAVNESVLDRALQDASDEIDGYLGGYDLPFAAPPPRLVRLCCDLAWASLWPDAVIDPQQKPEWARRRDAAIEALKGVAAGEIDLGLPAQAPKAAVARTAGNPRIFTRNRMVDL
jgi:phage gp36-like protein